MIVCTPVTLVSCMGSRPIVGEAYGELFLSLQHWRVCISCGSHEVLCNWWCHLSGIEWDIKESLRMTRSLAVTTLGVCIHEYVPHMHTRCSGCGLPFLHQEVLGPDFSCCSVALYPLDPGVNRYLVQQWLLVCLNSFQCHDGSRGCMAACSPGSWVGTGMDRSCNQEKLLWSTKSTNVERRYIRPWAVLFLLIASCMVPRFTVVVIREASHDWLLSVLVMCDLVVYIPHEVLQWNQWYAHVSMWGCAINVFLLVRLWGWELKFFVLVSGHLRLQIPHSCGSGVYALLRVTEYLNYWWWCVSVK